VLLDPQLDERNLRGVTAQILVERQPIGRAPQRHDKGQQCEPRHRRLALTEQERESSPPLRTPTTATRCNHPRPWNQVTQTVQRSLLLHGKGKFTPLDSRLQQNVVILFGFLTRRRMPVLKSFPGRRSTLKSVVPRRGARLLCMEPAK